MVLTRLGMLLLFESYLAEGVPEVWGNGEICKYIPLMPIEKIFHFFAYFILFERVVFIVTL